MPDTSVQVNRLHVDQHIDGSERTLALLLLLLSKLGLGDAEYRQLRSAVLSVARMLGASLDTFVVVERDVLARLHKVHPREVGVTMKRLRNLRSDFVRALKLVGWHEGRNTATFTPAWAALNAALKSKFERCAMTRFFRWCSEQEIAPDMVTDEVVSEFRHYLDTVDFCRSPATIQGDLIRIWNTRAGTVACWPETKLTSPKSDRFWSLPWENFLSEFIADVEAWLTSLAGSDPLSEKAPVKPMKPASIVFKRQQLRMFASAAVLGGVPIDSLRSIADLVALPTFKAALRYLRAPENGHGNTQPASLAICLTAAARYWVEVPEDHYKKLNQIVKNIRPPRKGMTEKNKAILRQLDNRARRHDLLTLPQRVLDEVRRLKKVGYQDALRVQLALAVELLLMTLIRRANLTQIHLACHLRWTRSAHGDTAHLIFAPSGVKNGEDLAFQLPNETVHLLKTYLSDYRPLLVVDENQHLFPGENGRHKALHRLSGQIIDFVYKETGLTVTTHSFRHIGVKLNLEANPCAYEASRQMLGQRDIETTVQYYASEERAAHLRRYDALIEEERSKSAPATPGRRQ